MENNYNQIEALLRRVGLFLEDGEWAQADAYCERILDMDPENARAYTGKLFAKFHAGDTRHFLQMAAQHLEAVMNDPNTKKILRFGTEQEKAMFQHILSGVDQERKRQQESVLNDSCYCVTCGHFDVALHNFDLLKEHMPNNHRLWFWRMMARHQCRNLFALVDKAIPVNKDPDFCKAVACADPFQAQSYRDTARQVLFAAHIKCQQYLIYQYGPWENLESRIDLYLAHCEEDDPYAVVYRTLRKFPCKDWTDALITGALIYLNDVHQKEMAAGRLKTIEDDMYSSEICSYIQVPEMYLDLEFVIQDRLKDLKEQILGIREAYVPSWYRRETVQLKALKNPTPRPTPPVLVRDYVDELLYQRYLTNATGKWKQWGTVITESVPFYTDHMIRYWCEPDCAFCRASGTEPIPLPQTLYAKDEPRQLWQRYAYMAGLVKRIDYMLYCAKQIQRLAPEEFEKQTWLKNQILDKLLSFANLTDLQKHLEQVEVLYPQDYRISYTRLRQISGDFQKQKKDFSREYEALANQLKQLKMRDENAVRTLQERYGKLKTQVEAYVQPLAQANKEHFGILSFMRLAGTLPEKEHYMVTKWCIWWNPIEDHTNQILQRISEDMQTMEQKSRKGFLWNR